MTDPVAPLSATPRFALPFLFATQAQKEFFVNEALARIDALLHPVVEGIAAGPPGDPREGQAWLVGGDAVGEWAQWAGRIAVWSAGDWIFLPPHAGMRLYSRASHAMLFHDGYWRQAPGIPAPDGGEVIDPQARAAIAALTAALRTAGIVS